MVRPTPGEVDFGCLRVCMRRSDPIAELTVEKMEDVLFSSNLRETVETWEMLQAVHSTMIFKVWLQESNKYTINVESMLCVGKEIKVLPKFKLLVCCGSSSTHRHSTRRTAPRTDPLKARPHTSSLKRNQILLPATSKPVIKQ
ncbi:hypothetical protein Dimus_039713 [Dionaea muscipula]